MRLQVDKITSTPSGLVMGVKVHGPGNAWLKFAILTVPWEVVPPSVVDDYWGWADRDEREVDLDEPLNLDWG